MSSRVKRVVKGALRPLRESLGRFALPPSGVNTTSIAYCADSLIVAEKIEGDCLEFEKDLRRETAAVEPDALLRLRLLNEGLPSLTGADRQTWDFVPGKYRCSQDGFTANLRKGGLPLERVKVGPGWFDEVLNQRTIDRFELNKAAIVHIDCDLYESARAVLEFLKPLLTDGTVVIFDDWYGFKANPDLGEQRASREWCEANPQLRLTEYHKEGPWKNSFIVNRRRSDTAR